MRRSKRSRTRAIALQALYHLQLRKEKDISASVELAKEGQGPLDEEFLKFLIRGVIEGSSKFENMLEPLFDKANQVNHIERVVLYIATLEMLESDLHYVIIINEAVELAKSFGGASGHKFVNGVLEKLALKIREDQVKEHKSKKDIQQLQQNAPLNS